MFLNDRSRSGKTLRGSQMRTRIRQEKDRKEIDKKIKLSVLKYGTALFVS